MLTYTTVYCSYFGKQKTFPHTYCRFKQELCILLLNPFTIVLKESVPQSSNNIILKYCRRGHDDTKEGNVTFQVQLPQTLGPEPELHIGTALIFKSA